jgi:exodeoxyribonuclease V
VTNDMELYGPCEHCGAARSVRTTWQAEEGSSLQELYCPACEPTIELSPDQQRALDTILSWYASARIDEDDLFHLLEAATLTLGGYAGTGKTTLLGQLQQHLPGVTIHFCSYTGKAVSVLQSKLPPDSTVTTLHRLLYKPRHQDYCKASDLPLATGAMYCAKHSPDDKPCEKVRKLEWLQNINPLFGINLVVVDEASMVSERIWTDLTKWGVPVLAVGDHGQLPPVKSSFNLMAKPDIKLETILRQAEGSPIIRMATQARRFGILPLKDFGGGCRVIRARDLGKYEVDPDRGDLIIAAYNRTRNGLNAAMREQLGHRGPPQVGDIVICLRNNYEAGIFNGMRGKIHEIELQPDSESALAVIDMDWGTDSSFYFTGSIYLPQFNRPKTLSQTGRWLSLFDYGYCITAHKAQGSEADHVTVINEHLPETDHKRWLYTAVTRAAKELIVVNG